MNSAGEAVAALDERGTEFLEDEAGTGTGPRRSMAPTRGQGIGLRLLALIVLFSSVVTLVLTGLQLFFDYQRDVATIESRLGEIEHSYLGSLAGSLWHVDRDQLQLQLEGILRLPDMQALEIRESMSSVARPLVIAVGQPQSRLTISRTFPITFQDRGADRLIGELYAEATLTGVYARLLDKGIVILISQGIKTFLVSLFILYVVYRLLTRHLISIANFLGDYDIHSSPRSLELQRRQPAKPDELDMMVRAFNGMRGNLERAYADLRAVNAALERDIVARRQAEGEVIRLNAVLEQRVRQRTAELEAANGELAAFSYSVSHDLRAPLRRIDGFGQMLIEGYGDRIDERGHHYLERIRAGTQEMADMIDSFLKLSRATRGELAIETLDMTGMARDVVSRLREKDPRRNITVTIQTGVELDGDRRLIGVVLTNLLDNAWKYTRKTETPVVEFGCGESDGRRIYYVRDNGAGFDMALADRLFTPFNRLHKSEDFEGTGIGLATVQRILARHGGTIWAEAAPGEGATFKFTCWEKRGTDE